MYSKLIINNWKAQPGKILLVYAALTIGLLLITLLSTLNHGLKNFFFQEGQQSKLLRELSVKPAGAKLDLNIVSLLPQAQLTPTMIEKIKAIPEVVEVLPTNTINGISSVQISLLGQIFQTDSLLYGAPYELLDSPTVQPQTWSQNDEPYPAVISTKLVDLYNYSFAAANNLPQVTPENFLGSEVTILLNKSTFFDTDTSTVKQLKARIVGFSPNVKLLGLTLPLETINRLNQNVLNKPVQNFLDATVRVQSPEDLTKVKNQLEEMGLNVTTAEESLKSLERLFSLTDLALNIFFAIIILLTGLLISSTFLAKIAEKSREIAILKTLGLSQNRVSLLYLLEAGLVGLAASVSGIILALLFAIPLEFLINQSLQNLLNKPEQFFVFQFDQLLLLIIFSIFISCCFTFFPARKAAKLDPAEILAR